MAQALFKSWFVDFDPVIDNALAAGNPIPEELQARANARAALGDQRKPLPEDIRKQFPDRFVLTEEMGWVPEGWKTSSAGEEFTVRGGSTPSTKNPEYWQDGQFHWTTPKDLSNNENKLLVETERKISVAGLSVINSGLLPIDTVLMSSRAPVGYLAITKIPVAINQGYIAICCHKTITPEFALQWLDSIMDHIKSISGGTTFAEISKSTFRGVRLLVPSAGAIQDYSSITSKLYAKILANTQTSKSLKEIRDSLLPKLLSGEIRLGEKNE